MSSIYKCFIIICLSFVIHPAQGAGLDRLIDTSDFPARWHCGNWAEAHGWTHIISDIVIWLAYTSIPIALLLIVRKMRIRLPYPWLWIMFCLFILSCGLTHLLEAIIFWWPAYRLLGLMKVVTAVISALTALALLPVIPKLLKMKTTEMVEKEIQTERKSAEMEKNHAVAQSDRKNIEMLTSQNTRLINFAHIVSHNLRSHAGNLTALIDMYNNVDDEATRQTVIEHFKNSSDDLFDTVNQLAEIVKIQTNINIERSPIRFDTYMDKVLKTLQGEITGAKARITSDFSKAAVINYSPDYLESILLNLVSNAIKYRDPTRPLECHITSHPESNGTVLSVSDNGLGIDLERYGDKIFGFYKTFHGNPDAKGVGLFLIKNQVESTNGSINISSQPGNGTTFTVFFTD